jgi:hypothetical protein
MPTKDGKKAKAEQGYKAKAEEGYPGGGDTWDPGPPTQCSYMQCFPYHFEWYFSPEQSMQHLLAAATKALFRSGQRSTLFSATFTHTAVNVASFFAEVNAAIFTHSAVNTAYLFAAVNAAIFTHVTGNTTSLLATVKTALFSLRFTHQSLRMYRSI